MPAPVASSITSATVPAASAVPVRPGVAAIGSTVDSDLIAPDGSTRTYRVHVPSGLTADRPVPLLVALHGGGGSGHQFETNSEFDEFAEANGFIVAYPDGTDIGPVFPGRAWNGGRCCGPAQTDRDNIDDVGFFDTLIDTLKTDYPIDSARVYAAGHSNGAILSYRLACQLADQIVAVGVQVGALEVDDCQPSRPVSMLHIHGTADTNVAIIEGANHAWMGHPTTRVQEEVVGPPFSGYDSSLAIWTFLAQQTR